MSKINIIIADDHALINKGVSSFLEESMPNTTIFQAENKSQVIRILKTEKIDIILQDINFGKEDARKIVSEYFLIQPAIQLIALSSYTDQISVKTTLATNFLGYVSKSAPMEEIIEAINAVTKGERYISSDIKEIVAKSILLNDNEGESIQLTRKEKQILFAIQDGFSSKEIADKLFLSTKSIESYRSNLFQKFQVKNAAELVKKSLLKGFYDDKRQHP